MLLRDGYEQQASRSLPLICSVSRTRLVFFVAGEVAQGSSRRFFPHVAGLLEDLHQRRNALALGCLDLEVGVAGQVGNALGSGDLSRMGAVHGQGHDDGDAWRNRRALSGAQRDSEPGSKTDRQGMAGKSGQSRQAPHPSPGAWCG